MRGEQKMLKKIIYPLLLSFICFNLTACGFSSEKEKQSFDPATIDYTSCVNGLRDWIIQAGISTNYLEGVQWNKNYVSWVTVDAGSVDMNTEGTYIMTYTIDIRNEEIEDIKKEVTVTVVSKEEALKLAQEGKEVVTEDGILNKKTFSTPTDSDLVFVNPSEDKPVENKSEEDTESTESTEESTENKQEEENNNELVSETPEPNNHIHQWVNQTTTIHHEATGHYEQKLVKEAIPIYVTITKNICNVCNQDITGNEDSHFHENGEPVSITTSTVSVYDPDKSEPAQYENVWVVDNEAWDETVVTGQICIECGATQ